MDNLEERYRKHQGSYGWGEMDEEITSEMGKKAWQLAAICATLAFVAYLFTL